MTLREGVGILLMTAAVIAAWVLAAGWLIDRGQHSRPRASWWRRATADDMPWPDSQVSTEESAPGWLGANHSVSSSSPGHPVWHAAPVAAPIRAVAVGDGVYVPLTGHDDPLPAHLPRPGPTVSAPEGATVVNAPWPGQLDDTLGDIRPEPRAGRPAWQPATPRPRVPCRDPEWVRAGGTWTFMGTTGIAWVDWLHKAPLLELEAAS